MGRLCVKHVNFCYSELLCNSYRSGAVKAMQGEVKVAVILLLQLVGQHSSFMRQPGLQRDQLRAGWRLREMLCTR